MKKEREKIRKLLSSYVALTMVLTAMVGMISMVPTKRADAIFVPLEEVPTLRVYGRFNEGAGDTSVCDPLTDEVVEDLPYTDAIAPFEPQHPQAPVKDSVTFNPCYISEKFSDDELLGDEDLPDPLPVGPYDDIIKSGLYDAWEKVFFRQWYEPWHWDKDVDGDGEWVGSSEDAEDLWEDVLTPLQWLRDLPPYVLQGKAPIEFISPIVSFNETIPFLDPDDEIYPAIMQEFTYMLVDPNNHQPHYGRPAETEFLFPIGMREEDIWSPYGYGLTGLDFDFDGEPDIVEVHSEKTLFGQTGIAADFDGGQSIDPIDPDGFELTGDEMIILATQPLRADVGERWQFLDHMIEVVRTYRNNPDEDQAPSVLLSVYYTGDLEPEWLGYTTISQGDMALIGRKLPVTYIKSVDNGGGGTNLCDFPTGPWFVWVQTVSSGSAPPDNFAYLMIGRALGHSHTGMENTSYNLDVTHNDPWFLKRFYVDGHEYNVVAIETYRRTDQWNYNDTDSWDYTDTNWVKPSVHNLYRFPDDTPVPDYMVNDLDSAWNISAGEVDNDIVEVNQYSFNKTIDESAFKYITIRTPIPKQGERQNPTTHEIEYAYRDEEYSVQGEGDAVTRAYNYYHLIEQHSVRLQSYFISDYLSVMPPYNWEHTIVKDVQTNWSAMRNEPDDETPYYYDGMPWGMKQWFNQPWDPIYEPDDGWAVEPQWIGDRLTRRPPITQKSGDYLTYDGRTIKTEHMMYVDEDINPQYKGELKEIYGEGSYPGGGDHEYEDPDEWFFVQQWHTLPDEFTEFVLPKGNEHYLLTSAFTSELSYGRILEQEKAGDGIEDIIWIPYGNRVKFWFNPMNVTNQQSLGLIQDTGDLKKYKCTDGIRIYGFDNEGAGDYGGVGEYGSTFITVRDSITGLIPEDKPYTDPEAPFDPRSSQAPRTDFLTFDPAYMDEYLNGGEELADLYKWICIEEADAREKVFHRMWYEPWHWDKDVNWDNDKLGDDVPDYDDDGLREYWELIWFLKHYPEYQDILDMTIQELQNPSGNKNKYDLDILDRTDEIYPALMQEFTYMFVDVWDFPDHGQPATSKIAFPIGTEFEKLGYWNGATFVSDGGAGDFGWGLTNFDANFDGIEDVCTVYSEYSFAKATGIRFDANGDGLIQKLDKDSTPLNGTEIVILAVEHINLSIGNQNVKDDFVMFLDHMVRIEDITDTGVVCSAYRTGGSTSSNVFPSGITATIQLEKGDAYVLRHGAAAPFGKINAGGHNLGQANGPWIIYLEAFDTYSDTCDVTVARALGCTFTGMEEVGGNPDDAPGDPWYMKRFYVDGHEYNVVAVQVHQESEYTQYKDEEYEFKYITIRTPVPKIPVVIDQHSQFLQNYTVCMNISVMPPFNVEHTARRDIVSGWTETEWWMMPFMNSLHGEWAADDLFEGEAGDNGLGEYEDFIDLDIVGELIKNKPPLVIHINEEDREPQFKGELKEKYNKRPKVYLNGTDGNGYELSGDFEALINISATRSDFGFLEGRSVDGGAQIRIVRTNQPGNGDGRVYGQWWINDAGTDDSPPLFFDDSLFYGDTIVGDIKGWFDSTGGPDKLHLEFTCHYTDLNSNDMFEYLEEWYLCFYAQFDAEVEIALNFTHLDRYDPGPGTQIVLAGGWDPADQYPDISAGHDTDYEVWMVEQWHTLPDQYTELGLPDDGQLYLLTSTWYAEELEYRDVVYDSAYGRCYAHDDDYELHFDECEGGRVTFWYDPLDCKDIYVNTAWIVVEEGEEPEWSPWDYDDYPPGNNNNLIDYAEVIRAIQDFFADPPVITKAQLLQVLPLYFDQTPQF